MVGRGAPEPTDEASGRLQPSALDWTLLVETLSYQNGCIVMHKPDELLLMLKGPLLLPVEGCDGCFKHRVC